MSSVTDRGQIVVVACSAGGLNALTHLLSVLPESLPAPVLVVQHMQPKRKSMLVEILRRRTKLKVYEAHDGSGIQAGCVYIAPPDRHLLVNEDLTIGLSTAQPVNFLRPSADMLFKSAAESCGKQALAVVLSGTGRDGAVGVQAIKRAGGTVIVQDEETSEFHGMPDAAQRSVEVDQVLPLDDIAGAVVQILAASQNRVTQ